MKLKFLFSLMLGCALSAAAQGYQDGVDNYNAGRYDVAKVILENNLNKPGTDKAVSYFYLGCVEFREGNLAKAKQDYEAGIAANPAYGFNYIGLGQVALKEGDKGTAEKYFKQGMECDKKNVDLTAEVGRAYFNVDPQKYAKDIEKYIDKAYKDAKKNKVSQAPYLLLQADMQANTDPGKAASLYEAAIESDKEKGEINREAYVKYANTYFHVNPRFAIEKLEELHKLEPNSGLAQRELAEKYYDNSQFGSAAILYGEYLQNPNHFQNDEQRYAGLLYSAGEYDKSLEWANKVLAKDPGNFYMYRVILLDQSAKENWPAAEEAGRKLFNTPGVDLIANDYILYGKALTNTGKGNEAVAVLEKAVELNPDKPELLTSLSDAYDKAGQSDKAVETYKKYLDGGNGTTNDLLNMGRRYSTLARSLDKGTPERKAATNEGIKYFNMTLERVPDNGLVYWFVGQIYLTGNDDEPNAEMAAAFEKMIDLFNADPANREKYATYYRAADYLLGIYFADKDKAKARKYLQDYLQFMPDDDQVRKLLDTLN
ncbi:MAG: tetratricopeptide repeat protein [Paramuribaculum sp.]|nr:tetratricopeptide repeat protein [Paramuribaculum sp.]